MNPQAIAQSMDIQNVLSVYANLPEHWRAHPEIAMRAVSLDGLALLYTPPPARSKEIVERAIRNCSLARIYVEGTGFYHNYVDSEAA